jgi:hypothetical protein
VFCNPEWPHGCLLPLFFHCNHNNSQITGSSEDTPGTWHIEGMRLLKTASLPPFITFQGRLSIIIHDYGLCVNRVITQQLGFTL